MKLFDKYPALKWLTNKYALTGLGFVIWMIFLDANNYFIHEELDQQIENLENDIEFYEETLHIVRVLTPKFVPIFTFGVGALLFG